MRSGLQALAAPRLQGRRTAGRGGKRVPSPRTARERLLVRRREAPRASQPPEPAIWRAPQRIAMGFVRPQRLFSGDPRTGGKRGDLSTHCYYLWSRSAVTFSSNLVLLCAAASGARKARLASPCPKVRRVPRPGLLADWGSVLLRDWDALDRFPSRLGFALKRLPRTLRDWDLP